MRISPVQDREYNFRGFEDVGRKIARGLNLRGIMDVEAIVSHGAPKVLEIDARMPSQTPSAVYQSSGLNMVQMVTHIFPSGPDGPSGSRPRRWYPTYEHLILSIDGLLYSIGEDSIIGRVRKVRPGDR